MGMPKIIYEKKTDYLAAEKRAFELERALRQAIVLLKSARSLIVQGAGGTDNLDVDVDEMVGNGDPDAIRKLEEILDSTREVRK